MKPFLTIQQCIVARRRFLESLGMLAHNTSVAKTEFLALGGSIWVIDAGVVMTMK
jgi:hypothetical protein